MGYTSSYSGLATNGAYQTVRSGSTAYNDGFIAKFNKDGGRIGGTYFGGPGDDYAYAICGDALGDVYISGFTLSSSGIATSGAYQTSNSAGNAFLAKFDFRSEYDAGLLSIVHPDYKTCAGIESVKVKLKNYGFLELDSVSFGFTYNHKLQKPYKWTGKLQPDSSTIVTIGNINMAYGNDTFKAWTYNPNGIMDSVPANDTTQFATYIWPTPNANVGSIRHVCFGDSVSIGVSSVYGDTYLWTSRPGKFTSTLSSPYIHPTGRQR